MKEGNKGLLGREILVDILPRILYKIHISEESQEKTKEIRETLDENQNLNFILYPNHLTYFDPLYAGLIVNEIDPEGKRHLIAPISFSHTQSRTKDSTLKMMMGLAKTCDLETIRIIQTYQVNNPKYGYTQEQANATYKKLFGRPKELKENNISTGMIIFPEGTRSQNGELGEAEKGITLLTKILEPVLLIPVGIYFDNKYKRSGLNFGKSVNLEVGETYLYEKGKERKDIDFYMKNLADTLPEKMRGRWAQMPEVRKNKD
jgi:1-acyl-sn-glycerol-3-phosphate acyltransferase